MVRILHIGSEWWAYRPYNEGPPINGKRCWKAFATEQEADDWVWVPEDAEPRTFI